MDLYTFWWIVFGVVGAFIGLCKGRIISGIILGLLLGPIGWVITLFAAGKWPCPACAKKIPRDTSNCPYCHSPVDPPVVKYRRLSSFGCLVSLVPVFGALAVLIYLLLPEAVSPYLPFLQQKTSLVYPSPQKHHKTLHP